MITEAEYAIQHGSVASSRTLEDESYLPFWRGNPLEQPPTSLVSFSPPTKSAAFNGELQWRQK
jgi:hypothetical protein